MAANSRRLVLRFESHLGRFIFGFERPSIASAVFVSLLIGIAPPPARKRADSFARRSGD